MNYETYSRAKGNGGAWLKVTLDQVHCVRKVVKYGVEKKIKQTWTCTEHNCSNCEGNSCSDFTLTVSTEGATPKYLPSISDCGYGDTVKLERVTDRLDVWEIVIIGETVRGNLN